MTATRVLLLLAVLAFGTILLIVTLIAALAFFGDKRVSGTTLLEVDLEQYLVEYAPSDPLMEALFSNTPQLRDFVDALERARDDDKVLGLVARVGTSGMGMAKIQEIRDAVLAFAASGKKTIAYAETFGEFGPGNGAYYLATAFEEIHLQPSGDVGLTGLVAESLFLRGTFDKLGMTPLMDHRHEFKNALNTYTETEYTQAHEEASRALLESQFSQMVRGIAEARGMEPEAVRSLADRGPFLGVEAQKAGLVDGLSYRDEVIRLALESTDDDADLLYLHKYLERRGRPHRSGSRIALIYGTGAVVRGSGGFDPLSGSAAMGADVVSAALRTAIDDPKVEAIVFRVDSPGGSYVASDTIWRETVRAKEAGKPVIVSMGDVAASGGYFVAAAADKIVAQPGTITGSIGVLGGKFLTRELWEKLGISWDEVHTSRNATMWSGALDYSEEEWQRLQDWLDRVYEDFTGKVAAGRGLEIARVHEIAKGRVWSGEEAERLGLVDALGGLDVALDMAREALGLDADANVEVRIFPRPVSPFEQLFGEGPDSSEETALRAVGLVLEAVQPAVRLATQLGLIETSPQPLRLPEPLFVP